MFDGQANELKQQGAIAAARDPNSTVTGEDAERRIVAETRKAGGAAFLFDPNASPEEKAAQARSRVPEGFHHERNPQATGIASDVDDGTPADYDLPAPTTKGVIALPSSTIDGKPTANGHTTDGRWATHRTGWESRFGNGDPKDDEGPTLLDHGTLLETHLEDKWFGDWYHNTGVIIFACLSTYVVTLLGGGLAWVFIVMAFCGTYYRTSLRRVRRNFRDDVKREMAKDRLDTDTESLEWINSFLVKFWPIYEPVLCEAIINSVDQVLSTSTPAFLDSLRMKMFTLGTKPPRLEYVKTYPRTDVDTVLMDWKFSFNPNDTVDLTSRQLKNKINPKIVLEVRIGKGIVSKALDVIVEDMACSGSMRVKVKLQIPFPHIEKAEICFLDKPTIDYVCKPLGGDMFGFDINFVPGLESFILAQVHANLGPMMYAPNVFPIEIAKMLAGNAVDQAIGVVQINLHGAQGLKNPDKFPGTPDPYTIISVNSRDVLGKSKTVMESANPKWNESFNVIVTSLKDGLTLQIYDWNEYRKDTDLGTATFQLSKLEHESVHENLSLEVMANGRARGVIQADIRFFPVLDPEKLADGTLGQVPESNTGIVKFTVEQAKDLDGSKSLIGQLSPYAVLLLNGKEVQVSAKLKRTNNPIWANATKELLITDRKSAKLGLVIKDDRGLSADPILGTYQIKLDDMLELMAKGQEWYHLAGATTGRAKMMLQWKPVALMGATAGSGGYIIPIGVMRFHFLNARDVRNLETVGKSDPYVRVLLSGIEKGRTVTFKSNLNPDFDEIIYVPVHSAHEKLILEVMDQEKTGAARSLGLVTVSASEYIHQAEGGEYVPHEKKTQRSEPLVLGSRGAKGTLKFTCAFYPTYNIADPEDEEKEAKAVALSRNGEMHSKSVEVSHGISSNAINGLQPSQAETEMEKRLAAGEKEQPETEVVKLLGPPKIKITAEDLSAYESGLLIFKLLDADLGLRDCLVEVVMDDMLFPSYKSSVARTQLTTFNETGDAMVREIDVSKITLRVRQKGALKDDVADNNCAKLTGNTLDVLRRGFHKPLLLMLKGEDGHESKITVILKYLPIKMRLDPSESINNMGTLRVDVLDGTDLPAADRNGFSDPYCKFILDGKDVFKTEIQKKTLHPAWNQFFEVNVKSRSAAKFTIECWDWDRAAEDDRLGSAEINLEVLEPFNPQEVILGLDGKSGAIRLKMLFKPAYVTRSRQGSSTFSGTFAAPGKVIGAPVKGVGKGAVLVGGNVVKGASFLGRGFRRRKTETGSEEAVETNEPLPARTSALESHPPTSGPSVLIDGQQPSTPQHSRQRSYGEQSTMAGGLGSGSSLHGAGESGTASITIVSASGFGDGSNVRISVRQSTSKGTKEIHKTKAVKALAGDAQWGESESCKVNCTADTQFNIVVKNAHAFSSDDLGEGTLTVADAASALGAAAGRGTKKVVPCGPGLVMLLVSFTYADSETTNGSVSGAGLSPVGHRRVRSFMPGRNRPTSASPQDGRE